MAIQSATTKVPLTNLLDRLLVDDNLCLALADSASRCAPAVRDSILSIVPRSKPTDAHGTRDATAAAAIAAIKADLEAND